MSASERVAQSRQQSSEPAAAAPLPTAVSMRDLLASCAAATAVSTPPGDSHRPKTLGPGGHVPDTHRPGAHRDAA
jgi:hypothetical protein